MTDFPGRALEQWWALKIHQEGTDFIRYHFLFCSVNYAIPSEFQLCNSECYCSLLLYLLIFLLILAWFLSKFLHLSHWDIREHNWSLWQSACLFSFPCELSSWSWSHLSHSNVFLIIPYLLTSYHVFGILSNFF